MFHATYVVICDIGDACQRKPVPEKELVAKCRLGTCVKKTILIAYFDKQNSVLDTCDSNSKSERIVKYKVLRWTATLSSDRKPAGDSHHNPKCDTSEDTSVNPEMVGGIIPTHVKSNANSETKNTQKGSNKERRKARQSRNTDNSDSIGDVLEELGSSEFWKPFE